MNILRKGYQIAMRFIDEVKIIVEGGHGGNGCVSFRREKFVPRGGPNGGDGGNGGNVYLIADPDMRTLLEYHYQRHYKAEDGKHGRGKNQRGRDGADLELRVPVGTVVYDDETQELIADLSKPGMKVLVARGGRGGRGNTAFKTATFQAPKFAERGLPGQVRKLRLELRLLADVGIVGLPNAGKSTLISRISNARPKVADYPFTTLVPNLGLVRIDRLTELVFADLPGLIEGAHLGKGLGDRFLKHVKRSRILLHLIDITRPNPVEDYRVIMRELEQFDPQMLEKPMLVVLNKVDAIDRKLIPQILETFKSELGFEPITISAVTGENLRQLLWKVKELFMTAPEPEVVEQKPQDNLFLRIEPTRVEVEPLADNRKLFKVEDSELKELILRFDLTNFYAQERFAQEASDSKFIRTLKLHGIKPGDIVKAYGYEFEYLEGTLIPTLEPDLRHPYSPKRSRLKHIKRRWRG